MYPLQRSRPRSLTHRTFRTVGPQDRPNSKKMKSASHQQIVHPRLVKAMSVKSNAGPLHSKIFSIFNAKVPEPLPPHNLYENFARELNIRLPTPREKFLEFIHIPPFNRLNNHIEFISHILKVDYLFFRKHPATVVDNIARKIVKMEPNSVLQDCVLILASGRAYYNSRQIKPGMLITRNNFDPDIFSHDACSSGTVMLGLSSHDYSLFVSQYLNQNLNEFKRFISSLQIFKIFPESCLQKIYTGLNIGFYSKGQVLYSPGEEVTDLFLIHSGEAIRKVIVEIDQTNRIPIRKYSKLIKVTSRYYQHKIEFHSEDLMGVSEIIDNISHRREEIMVNKDATILSIDRVAIQESFDEYIIDRFRKYNMKKYPSNYDKLCENYFREKTDNRRAQERKIAVLCNEMGNAASEKKNSKISGIINDYKNRIKQQERENLIKRKKMERVVHNQG